MKAGETVDLRGAPDPAIPAAWLHGLLDADRAVGVRISLSHATVEGDLDLSSASFKRDVSITDCTFTGHVNLEYASLASYAKFDGCTFASGVSLHAASVASDLLFRTATLCGTVSMVDLRVDGVLDASGARFDTEGTAEFERIRIGKSLVCKPAAGAEPGATRPTCFLGVASFIDAQIGSQAEFDGAQFEREVRFSGLAVEDGAFFRDGVRFGGEAVFRSASFKAQAVFRDATFEGPVSFGSARFQDTAWFRSVTFQKDVRFDQMTVASTVAFDEAPRPGAAGVGPPTRFCGDVRMTGARFSGLARFTGTVFEARSDLVGVEFAGEADFAACAFGRAVFDGTNFARSVTFERARFIGAASFRGAGFGHRALFGSASFDSDVDFCSISSSGELSFLGATFHSRARFADSTLKLVSFRDSLTDDAGSGSPQFWGPVDMLGCSYDRVLVAWKELLCAMAPAVDARRIDRQPYIQLAKALAAAGDDYAAGCVYYARRGRERTAHWNARDWGEWSWSALYNVFARYGVRPYRLVGIVVTALLAGSLVFSRPGAVVLASGKADQVDLGWLQGLIVSLSRLLPVDLGLGSKWKPSVNGIAAPWVNTGLKLCGWLIVPVAVAATTRAVYRRFVET